MRPQAAELARWRAEPWYFVRRVLRLEPDDWQDEVLHALVGQLPDGRPMPVVFNRFALQACKGPGKSGVLAMIMWWFMCTRPHPKLVGTSITKENLADNLWSELAKWQKRSPLLTTAFEWTQDRIYERRHPETWFMSARSFPKSASPEQQADTLAGIHADHVMFVLDESGSIPPGVLATADAGLANVDRAAGREAFLLQAGNPTDVTGALYEAAMRQRALWWVKEINGDPADPKRAKRVSIKWAQEQIDLFGRDHPFVLVNVLGRFPPSAVNSLISLHNVVAAKNRKLDAAAYHDSPRILGIDIARFGNDETAFCYRQGPLVHPLVIYRNIDLMATAGHAARTITELEPDATFIDETGLGAGVVDRLREMNYLVQGVNFAESALDTSCLNRRAEMWLLMSRWMKGEVALPDDPQLISELPAPTYKFNSNGKLQLEAKDEMKKRGLQSPNRADALGLTFAAPVPHKALRSMQNRNRTAATSYDWRTGKAK